MSTTVNKDTAYFYGKKRIKTVDGQQIEAQSTGLLMEMSQGLVNRGADITELSQCATSAPPPCTRSLPVSPCATRASTLMGHLAQAESSLLKRTADIPGEGEILLS